MNYISLEYHDKTIVVRHDIGLKCHICNKITNFGFYFPKDTDEKRIKFMVDSKIDEFDITHVSICKFRTGKEIYENNILGDRK